MTGDDQGSASIWTLSLLLVLLILGGAAVAVTAVLSAHARAVTAADLAAIAAANEVQQGEGEATACRRAARVASGNGARLVACRVAGEIVDVVAEVVVRGIGARAGPARASARAGPVPVNSSSRRPLHLDRPDEE